MTYTFKIERPARTSGGDRYICLELPDWQVYFPQSISRKGTEIKPEIQVEIKE